MMTKKFLAILVVLTALVALAFLAPFRGSQPPGSDNDSLPGLQAPPESLTESESQAAPEPQDATPARDPKRPSLHSDTSLAIAIDRAAGYLATLPLTPDVYWLAKRVGHALGGEFDAWKDSLELADYRNNLAAFGYPQEAIDAWIESYSSPPPLLTPLAVPDGLTPLPTPWEFDESNLREVIEVTILGLRCTVACEPATVEALLLNLAEPGADYVLTHQMLSLVLAYQFDCISQEEFEPLRAFLATIMLQELLGDIVFTDLTAERMAMLSYAGLTNWIPESFIEMAIDMQQANGRWPEVAVFGPDSIVSAPPEHTAGLALFALAHVWLEEQAAQH